MTKKMLYLILLVISGYYNSYAGNLDSLLNEVEKAKGNAAKQAELYCRISFSQLGNDVVSAISYARKAIEIARKEKLNAELSKGYVCLTYAFENHGDLDAAILTADSALLYAKQSNTYTTHFHAELMMGALYRKKANFQASIRHAMNALKIAEDNKDDLLLGNAYNNLGIIYTTLKDLTRAESFHLKSLAVRKKLNDAELIAQSYNNLGIINREREQYDKALNYYKQALAISISQKDTASMAFLYNDIGAAYSKKGDVVNGEKYLKESIDIREKIAELNELAYTYNYLGENYERKKDLVNASLYIKKALATAKQIGNNKQTYEALESLSDFYARNNMYDSAYRYTTLYRVFRDSIRRLDNEKTIAELTTKYETGEKERKIKEQQYELDKRNYLLAGISCILLLSALLGYNSYKKYKLKQESKLQLTILHQQELASKGIIEAEEKERSRIASELHDGVGQLMSAAKMNLSLVKTDIHFESPEQEQAFDKALLLVDESCSEVRTVSHNIMPNALLKSGLSSAIREFLDKIDARVLKVNLHIEGINERMETNVETVLYRVIQECVNNVIKHAKANRLDISLIKDEDGISVSVEDNGNGFVIKELSQYEGIGLKNIYNRINYLKGTVEWDASYGRGTIVTIHIPNS